MKPTYVSYAHLNGFGSLVTSEAITTYADILAVREAAATSLQAAGITAKPEDIVVLHVLPLPDEAAPAPAPAEDDDGTIYSLWMRFSDLVWYFDQRREFVRAMYYALGQGMSVAAETVDEVPEGDFISDADEYITWLEAVK